MKKLLTLMLISIFSIAFSQEKNSINEERVISTDSVYTDVDIQAEYIGGIEEFRKDFQNNFKLRSLEGVTAKSVVSFVVFEDGGIGNIVAEGESEKMNKEMERVIKKFSKKKWKPAEIKGVKVKSIFRLPMTIQF